MHATYNLFIRCYALSIYLASFFNEKANLWIDGRKNWKKNLPKINSTNELVWFHCASLGEFDQGLPLMKEMKTRYPDWKILVTFFSPSGMLHYSKRNHCADFVCYLPLDTPSNANYFMNYFSPKKIYFVKYEFWPNYILSAKKNGVPIYSVSSNFRANQHFFKWYGSFFRSVLKKIDYFFVQTDESKKILNSVGITKVNVSGDTRFDNVVSAKNRLIEEVETGIISEDLNKINEFLKGEKAIIIGSSWPEEEDKVIPFILLNPHMKFIIAPHDISEKHILKIENQLKGTSIRFTKFSSIRKSNCLILDTIGHLSKAYYFGKVAIVGGGFSGKLHNILEPAVFGLPVLFGPNHSRFPEATMFLHNGIAFEFINSSELHSILNEVFEKNKELSYKIQNFVGLKIGASQKIVDLTCGESN